MKNFEEPNATKCARVHLKCQIMCLLTMLPDEELPMHMKARRDVTGNPQKDCVHSPSTVTTPSKSTHKHNIFITTTAGAIAWP